MSCRLLRPLPRLPASVTRPTRRGWQHHPLSTFSSSVAPQALTATGTLPYSALAIYEIITDISSYPDFIPYIISSRVLQHSQPDSHYKRSWPQLATLRIGYGDAINEEFTSQILCVPPVPENGAAGIGIIEAVSGSTLNTQTKIPAEQIAHHTHPSSYGGTEAFTKDSPLEFLLTRWTLHASPYNSQSSDGTASVQGAAERKLNVEQKTDVTLCIEYKFRNRIYDMIGSTVAPRMAESMVLTFERRVKSLLGGR